MTPNPMLFDRIRRFQDTVRGHNTGRVINYFSGFVWPAADCGYKLNTIARDYTMRKQCADEFQTRYNFDFSSDFWSTNPLLISDPLGGSVNILIDDPFSVEVVDHNYMNLPEDLELCRKNYTEFLWTKLLPRKFPQLMESPDPAAAILESQKELAVYFDYCYDIEDFMMEKHGTYGFFTGRTAFLTFFLQNLFLDYSGMKEMSLAMRRYKEQVKEACDQFGLIGTLNMEKGTTPGRAHDYTFRMLAQTFLSAKQFETFVYPAMQRLYKHAEEADKVVFCFVQGENSRFYDYFKEAPAGHFMWYLEKDDLAKAKKVFENHSAIAGGLKTSMLGGATPEKCVDHAKELLDTLNYDGKYMIGPEVFLTFPNDARRENLLAVSNYLNSL